MEIGLSISPVSEALREFGEKIDRLAIGVEPAGVPPAGADQHVSPLIEHDGDAVGLQIGAIGDANLAFDHRNPIERLAPMLIGEFEMAEPLGGKVEGAVNAPQLVPSLGRRPAFGTVVASMMRIRRPRLACGAAAASASPTKSANQSPHRRRR